MRKFKKVVALAMSATLLVSSLGIMPPTKFTKTVQAAGIDSSAFLKASGKVLKNNYGNGNVVYLFDIGLTIENDM